jgi:hypothetical protein
VHLCIATYIGSSLPDLFLISWSPSHSGLCQLKITLFAPLQWTHQPHSSFRILSLSLFLLCSPLSVWPMSNNNTAFVLGLFHFFLCWVQCHWNTLGEYLISHVFHLQDFQYIFLIAYISFALISTYCPPFPKLLNIIIFIKFLSENYNIWVNFECFY